MKKLLFPFMLSAVISCQKDVSIMTNYADKSGKIRVNVATRGSYQYILSVDDKEFMPIGLTDEYKKDGIEVIFSGEIQKDSSDVMMPAANDIPTFAKKIPNINISKMKLK
jgi:hypothetical protein